MTAPSQVSAFNYASPPFVNWPIKQITSTYTLLPSDNGYIINCASGTFTINLVPTAPFQAGFCCWVWNTSNTAADVITLQGNASQTIDASSSIAVRKSSGTQIIFDGVRWQVGARTTMRGYSENINNNSQYAAATATGAMAIGQATASGSYSTAIGFEVTASASNSFAAGINSGASGSQAVTGSGAMALGGSRASGADSFAAAVANNTSSYGAQAANSIAIGQLARASGSNSAALGAESIASGSYSTVINGVGATDGGIWGKHVIGSGFSAAGQTGTTQLRILTTDATATVLRTNGSTPGSGNQVALNAYTAFAFTGTVVARQQGSGGTQSAAWNIEGLIRKEASNITTTLVASTVTVISNAPGWTLALSADTTNGALTVTATGALATNIKWLATVQTTEITYA